METTGPVIQSLKIFERRSETVDNDPFNKGKK